MSASSSPRPLAGLAAAALVVGLVGAPLVAYADPTPTPDTRRRVRRPPRRRLRPRQRPSAPTSRRRRRVTDVAVRVAVATESTPSDRDAVASDDVERRRVVEPRARTPSDRCSVAVGDAIDAPGPTESAAPTPEVAGTGRGRPEHHPGQVGHPDPGVEGRSGGHLPLRGHQQRRASRSTDVGITDELEGLTGSTCTSRPAPRWRPGQALSCSASLTVTQADPRLRRRLQLRDRLRQLRDPGVPETDYVGANAAARVVVDQSPSIALKASVSPTGTADQGDRLRYRATATNTGNVTLTAARITSSLDVARSRLRAVGPGDPGARREHQLRRLLPGDRGGRAARPGDQRAHRPGGAAVRCHRLQQRRRDRRRPAAGQRHQDRPTTPTPDWPTPVVRRCRSAWPVWRRWPPVSVCSVALGAPDRSSTAQRPVSGHDEARPRPSPSTGGSTLLDQLEQLRVGPTQLVVLGQLSRGAASVDCGPPSAPPGRRPRPARGPGSVVPGRPRWSRS